MATSKKKSTIEPFFISLEDDDDYNGNEDAYQPRTIKQILKQSSRSSSFRPRVVDSPLRQAALLPREFFKNPSISGQSTGKIDEFKFTPPLSKKTKQRLIQVYQDYTVSSAIATLIHFVLGRNVRATIYPTSREQLKTQEEVNEKLLEVSKEFGLGIDDSLLPQEFDEFGEPIPKPGEEQKKPPFSPAPTNNAPTAKPPFPPPANGNGNGNAFPPNNNKTPKPPVDNPINKPVDELIEDTLDIGNNKKGPKSLKDLQNYIDMVDLQCELYEKHIPQAMASEIVFGQAALWKVYAKKNIEDEELLKKWGFVEGTPIALRPLASLHLSQIHYDSTTWEPKQIEYDDNLGGIDTTTKQRKQTELIDMEDLIYFTRNDYNILADSYGYGFTQLLDIIPISESKRKLIKKVLPEINNNMWAGLNVFEIPGMSRKDMEILAMSLKPGRNKITNQPMTVHNVSTNVDMMGMLEQLKQLHLNELMGLKVPSFLMNFEQITNRATTEAILSAWRETVLEAERNHIRMVLWKYWYRPLVEQFFPDKKFLYLRIKVLQEFQEIEFASLFEKAVAITNLFNAKLIDDREAREMINLPPFAPEQEAQKRRNHAMMFNNPDLQPGLDALGKAQAQEEEDNPFKKKDEEETDANGNNKKKNPLLIKGTRVRNTETILNRLKRPPRPGGR